MNQRRLWIAVGRDQLLLRDGPVQHEVVVRDGLPDVQALASLARGRAAHVLVGPSLAQVRRVSGPAAGLPLHDAAGIVANHMEDTFVGVPGELALVQCAREGTALWAWAVPVKWRQGFDAACRKAGLRIESLSPLSRFAVPDERGDGSVVTCVDGVAAAVVRLEGGQLAQEWRAAASHARDTWDATAARTLGEALMALPPDADLSPLAAPSAGERLAAHRRRQLGFPIAIAAAALLASLVHPEVARDRELRALRAQRAQLDSADARAVATDSLLRLLDSYEAVNEQIHSRRIPFLSPLAVAARALGDDGLLLSFAADSATVTLVVTAPSTAAVVDGLVASRHFASVRISGDIVRTPDWRAAVASPGSTSPVPSVPSAPRPGLTRDDAHMERATLLVTYRTPALRTGGVSVPDREAVR